MIFDSCPYFIISKLYFYVPNTEIRRMLLESEKTICIFNLKNRFSADVYKIAQ